ncbi:MAG: rhomboid family intramembrane serine protease [Bacteroidetes bacterium]|nr:rhomboid family intramembrane serine protease [Bacteroidota bacterium]
MAEVEEDRNIQFVDILFPLLFLTLLWAIRYYESYTDFSFVRYGLLPRTLIGLQGILFGPLIHADTNHLISNSLPLFIMGSAMFYFYRQIAFKVFFLVYILTGIWVWLGARSSAYHIGASGILYGFVCFLFYSGIFRKDKRLLAVSLLVVFIYGGMVWGILPIKSGFSWESHLYGSIAGLIVAYFYRNEGPRPPKYEWEEEEEVDSSLPKSPNDSNTNLSTNVPDFGDTENKVT